MMFVKFVSNPKRVRHYCNYQWNDEPQYEHQYGVVVGFANYAVYAGPAIVYFG